MRQNHGPGEALFVGAESPVRNSLAFSKFRPAVNVLPSLEEGGGGAGRGEGERERSACFG